MTKTETDLAKHCLDEIESAARRLVDEAGATGPKLVAIATVQQMCVGMLRRLIEATTPKPRERKRVKKEKEVAHE